MAKHDKNNKNNKSNAGTYVLIVFAIIAVAAATVFSYFYTENKNKEMEVAYTDLIKQIDNKEINEIEMTSGNSTAKVKYKGKEDKKDIKLVSIPDKEAFTELVQEKVKEGNDIKLIQKQTNILVKMSSTLVQFIPSIIILTMFLMLFRVLIQVLHMAWRKENI